MKFSREMILLTEASKIVKSRTTRNSREIVHTTTTLEETIRTKSPTTITTTTEVEISDLPLPNGSKKTLPLNKSLRNNPARTWKQPKLRRLKLNWLEDVSTRSLPITMT
jgi:hypothetical protein